MQTAQRYRAAGTALVCFSLLVYEVFSARLLSVVVEGEMAIFALALAMLGMGAATSVMSLTEWPRDTLDRDRLLSRLAIALGLAYPICLLFLTATSEHNNTAIDAAMTAGGFQGLIGAIRDNILVEMIWIGSILFVPYFLFGIFIAALFRSCDKNDYHKLYAADLVGASVGCIAFVIALDFLGYAGGLLAVVAPTFLGGAAFAWISGARRAAIPLFLAVFSLFAFQVPSIVSFLEPQPSLNKLARNYNQNFDVKQDWHVWNAHSRVAELSLKNRETGKSELVYAHEAGAGWAIAPRSAASFGRQDGGITDLGAQWTRLAAVFKPKRVLVLFAGVGRDMAYINDQCGGSCDIVGVEINGHMLDRALSGAAPTVNELLANPHIRFVRAEAREYLGRDQSKYDAILLSWWGAGTSHYLGTSGQLAQYLYTKEAFETLTEHLTSRGIIVLLNGNKAQTLVNFREAYREEGWGPLRGKIAILAPATQAPSQSNYMEIVDTKRMVVKPSGFNNKELDQLQVMAPKLGLKLIYSPAGVAPGYRIYADIVDGTPLGQLNSNLIQQYDSQLSIVTDNRPFFEHFVPNSYYTDSSKWFKFKANSPQWNFMQIYVLFVCILAIASLIIIIGPVLLRGGPALSGRNVMNMFYFMCLGAGFILIEIAFVRKFGLILGHPSYAIAVVLAALIFSTGIGSLCTERLFAKIGIDERHVALAIVFYAVAGSMIYNHLESTIIAFPIPVKALFVILALFPLGFMMGQLFPQGLKRVAAEDSHLVPWAWAINATASTVGVGFADLIAHPLGFDAVLYIGAACYASIAALPLYSRQWKPVPA